MRNSLQTAFPYRSDDNIGNYYYNYVRVIGRLLFKFNRPFSHMTRIDAFELWCWRRLLRVTWTARRSNQSLLKEICPEYSLEGLMLKLQYFGHMMCRTNSLDKTLMLGKTEGGRRGG